MDNKPEAGTPAVSSADFKTERIAPELDCLRTGIYSDQGRRESQQDRAYVTESYTYISTRRALAVLCDGMGGMNAGEIASGYCVEQMIRGVNEVLNANNADKDLDIPFYYGLMLKELDEQIHAMRAPNGDPLGAGTTFISVLIDDGLLYWASVGDSRIYIINDVSTACLTRDHNYKMLLDEQVRRGQITRAAANANPKKEALLSYVGMGGLRYRDITEDPFPLKGGDRILLCSDGLYRTLRETEMARIIREAGDDMEAAARELVQTAVGKGKPHQDNTTAVVLKYLNV